MPRRHGELKSEGPNIIDPARGGARFGGENHLTVKSIANEGNYRRIRERGAVLALSFRFARRKTDPLSAWRQALRFSRQAAEIPTAAGQ